jgi:N-succinyldiaminopimelate aminotransferase
MPKTRPAFRDVPFMGVIHVNVEAMKVGFRMGDPNWSNLGQGQPEIGVIPGAPARFSKLALTNPDHAYGPVEGIPELREAVAAHYNRLYRKGKASQYTAENICIAPGGRAALTRVGAALDKLRLGYFTPDYTAYEDLLSAFPRIDPVHIELPASNAFHIDPEDLAKRVKKDRLGALLISNPCNPTGAVIADDELAAWVRLSRQKGTTLLMDEFYSHYVFGGRGPVSAAAYVDNVNEDPVVIFDGLTKCYRYPGWRVGWVVAPKSVIRAITAAGSFLDGGPSKPIQKAALEVMQPARADGETRAMQAHFQKKRDLTLSRLRALGVEFRGDAREVGGTFYAFGSVAKLPAPLNTGEGFMREGFKQRVLTVPGVFFDVNPHKKRKGRSPLHRFVRFSFGPPVDNLTAGLDRLTEMVEVHRSAPPGPRPARRRTLAGSGSKPRG